MVGISVSKKSIVIASIILLTAAGYLVSRPERKIDFCKVDQLQMSQTEIKVKDRELLALHMDHSFHPRTKKYLRHIKSAKSKVFYKKGKKLKPSLVGLTTEFKSKKKARSAYRYLKRKWKKKDQYDVVIKDRSVTWFRNSYYTPQCFSQAMRITKEKMGFKSKKKVAKKAKRAKNSKATKKRNIASRRK